MCDRMAQVTSYAYVNRPTSLIFTTDTAAAWAEAAAVAELV
jgi:hypothetical protein